LEVEMRTSVTAGIAALSLACGCGDGGGDSSLAVVDTEDGRSTVDTLVLLVAARTTPADADGSAEFLASHHVRRVRIAVDNEEWGLFGTDEPVAESDVEWIAGDQPSQALVVAELGTEIEYTQETGVGARRDTIAEWVSLLERHLYPGGHVAELLQVDLESSLGDVVTLEPGTLVPFEIDDGDGVGYLGELVVDVDLAGGEP
jgi:hypothetical protein